MEINLTSLIDHLANMNIQPPLEITSHVGPIGRSG